MKNLQGVTKINGFDVLVMHSSITEKNKEGFNIFVDFNKQELTFSGFALIPETLRKAADLLDMVVEQDKAKSPRPAVTERVANDKPNVAAQPKTASKKKAAPKK